MFTSTLRMSDPKLRSIPVILMEYAENLNRARLSPGKIFRALVEDCRDKNIPVTFVLQDIQNLFRSDTEQNTLDCTNFVAYLEERKLNDCSQDFEYFVDSEGTLDRLIFVLKDGKELLQKQGDNKVVLFNTKH